MAQTVLVGVIGDQPADPGHDVLRREKHLLAGAALVVDAHDVQPRQLGQAAADVAVRMAEQQPGSAKDLLHQRAGQTGRRAAVVAPAAPRLLGLAAQVGRAQQGQQLRIDQQVGLEVGAPGDQLVGGSQPL